MAPDATHPRPSQVAPLAAIALLLTAALLCGCQRQPISLSPVERMQLEQRATDLLFRAAGTEDPVAAANAIEALVQVAPDEGWPCFRAALRSDVPVVRFAGLTALGTLRDQQSQDALRSALSDPNQMVRLGAAFAVYRTGDTAAGRVLVRALNDSPDESVRAEAAHLIGLLEEPRAVKNLRAALRVKANLQSHQVSMQVYTALARLGDDDSVRRLIEYAQGSALTRLMALQSLAELGPEQAREALLYRLGPGEEYLMHRLIAARGLAKLGSNAGYELAVQNLDFVGTDADDPDETMRIRSNAALVLAEIGDPRALPALRQLAETASDPRIQVAAAYAICRITAR